LWGPKDLTCQFVKGDKVDLVDPGDKKKVVVSGQVEGVVGELFHFKKIQENMCKVVVRRVIDGNIGLFAPNKEDCPPHRYLKDVEGTCTLWEYSNLQYLKALND